VLAARVGKRVSAELEQSDLGLRRCREKGCDREKYNFE
jgi:hypothetical protein